MPDPLAAAEAFLAAAAPADARAHATLAALGERVASLCAARDAAEGALDAKRRASAGALRDVKLVAARMVQDREAAISALKRANAALEARLGALASALGESRAV